jgi:hypothetical protein
MLARDIAKRVHGYQAMVVDTARIEVTVFGIDTSACMDEGEFNNG